MYHIQTRGFFFHIIYFLFLHENTCCGYSCFYWVPLHMFFWWTKKNISTIMKTYLYYFNPPKPHFYIVKNWGLQGVYIIFLISAQKHRLWVLIRTALLRQFYRVPTIYVLSRNMKNISIFLWKFSFFGGKIFIIFE